MVLFEAPDFDGCKDESPWIFVQWINEMEQFFEWHNWAANKKVRFAKMKLIGRAQVFWEELEYILFIKQESSITDWEDMKVKLQDEYLSPYFRAKYLPQSYYGNSQVQQGNTRYWSSQPIAPFQENKMSIRSVSNPQPTQAPSSMAQALKNLEQAIQNTSTELQRINARLDSVEKSFQTKPNHLENVASTFVQQEELIVEPKQQEKKDSTLLDEEKVPQESEILKGAHEVKFDCDECATSQPSKVLKDTKLAKVDKIDTIVLPPIEEKTSPFDSLIPHIDFVIPNIFSDVVEHQIFLFFMLPKVNPDLKQASSVRILIIQHFKTRGRVFSNQRRMMRNVQRDYFNLVLFTSQLYFIGQLCFRS